MTEVAGWVKQNRHPVEEGSMEQMGALEKRTSSLRYFGNGVLAKCKAQVIQCLSGVGQRSSKYISLSMGLQVTPQRSLKIMQWEKSWVFIKHCLQSDKFFDSWGKRIVN